MGTTTLTPINFREQPAPPSPAANLVALYVDSANSHLTQKTAAGVVTDLAAGDVTTTTTQLVTGLKTFQSSAAGAIALIVKGAASQTANLQEWQDSTGATLALMGLAGTLATNSADILGGLNASYSRIYSFNHLYIDTVNAAKDIVFRPTGITVAIAGGAAVVGLIVRGAASQTADLQMWQNSAATALAAISSDGYLHFSGNRGVVLGDVTVTGTPGISWYTDNSATGYGIYRNNSAWSPPNYAQLMIQFVTGIVIDPGNAFPFSYVSIPNGGLRSTGANYLLTANAGIVPATVKGMTAQAANLQEWQNNAGTVLAYVNATGCVASTYGIYSAGPVNNDAVNYAHLHAEAGTATSVKIIARGAASQTADLQQWQNNGQASVAALAPSGDFRTVGSVGVGRGWAGGSPPASGGIHQILFSYNGAADSYRHSIRTRHAAGVMYSNAIDLLVYDANTPAIGALPVNHVATFGANGSGINVGTASPPGQFAVFSGDAARVVSVVRAHASVSQTADLQQWQDYAGGVVGRIDTAGRYSEKSLTFTPTAAGWYRINTGINMSGGTIKIMATFDIYATDVEFQFNIMGYVLGGSINQTRFSNYNGGAITAARISSDGAYFTYLDIYVTPPSVPGTFGPVTIHGSGFHLSAFTAAPVVGAVVGSSDPQTLTFGHGFRSTKGANFAEASGNVGIGTNAPTAKLMTVNDNPGVVAQITRGAASQSAALHRYETSAGVLVGLVRSDGLVGAPYFTNAADSGPFFSLTATTISLNDRGTGNGIFLGISPSSLRSAGIAVAAAGPTTIPIIAVGAASQTASLQEWQDSAGVALSKIDSAGAVRTGSIQDMAASGPYILPLATYLMVASRSSTQTALLVRGATSQSASIQDWQNSAGTVLASMGATGVLTLGAGPTVALHAATKAYVDASVNAGAVAPLTLTSLSVAVIPLTLKGAASQTGNLQEWQNSAGTVLAKIANDGSFLTAGPVTSRNGNSSVTTAADQIVFGFAGGDTYRHSIKTRHNAGAASLNSIDFFVWDTNLASTALPVKHALTVDAYGVGVNIGTTAPVAQFSVFNDIGTNFGGTSKIAMILRAGAGQANDIYQVQTSAGVNLISINQFGSQTFVHGIYVTGPVNDNISYGHVNALGGTADSVKLMVQGTTSQTADLTQWKDAGGTVVSYINSLGTMSANRGVLAVNPVNNDTSFGHLHASAGTASTVKVIVVGAASQSADLMQWKNSAGTLLAKVKSDGLIAAPYFRDTSDTGPYFAMSTTQIVLQGIATGTTTFQVRSASGQTANIQEWVNVNASGLYAAMDFTGRLLIGSGNSNPPYIVCGTTTHPGTITTSMYVVPGSTGWVGITVRGLASQTGDLQQWQNSAGSIMAKVRNDGLIACSYIRDQTDTGPYIAFGAATMTANGVLKCNTTPAAADDLTRKDYVDTAAVGELAYAESTAVQTLTSPTVYDVTGLSITFTVTAGRPVLVTAFVPDIYMSGVGANAAMYITDAANTVTRQAIQYGAAGGYISGTVQERITAAGTYTRKLRVTMLNSTGTLNQGGVTTSLTAFIRATR